MRSPGIKSAAVAIRQVSKVFGNGFRALDDIDLDIAEGQFLSIVGPSGCGKSTLLQIVAGLASGSGGHVLIDGKPVTKPQPHDIAVIFQDALLLPWKTTLQNVEFPLDLQGVTAAERKAKSVEMLNLVGLGDFMDNYPHELSGGMRQRVSIARGLAQDPRIILMDEPFGALDEQTRIRMGQELLKDWEQTRKTVLFITHSLTEAIFLSDVVVVMGRNPGRILERIPIPLPRPRDADMMGSDSFDEPQPHLAPAQRRWSRRPDQGGGPMTRYTLIKIAATIVFLLVWELICRAKLVNPIILAPPSDIIAALLSSGKEFLGAFRVTLASILAATALAWSIGIGFGLVAGLSPLGYGIFSPLLTGISRCR